MHKVPSPGLKRNSFIPEGLTISDNPDAPGSSQKHFHEETVAKGIPSMQEAVLWRTRTSLANLHIIPYPAAEVAREKQM